MGDITNLTQLRLDNFTLQPILDSVPPKDSNFTISIESFPNITQTGVINVSYNMTEYKLAISNLFGEPIISIDWDRWIQVLDNLAEQEFVYDKKIESVHYEQTNETFKSTIIIKPTIPTSMRLYLTRITINQTQCYFTTTGIQAYMVIITSFSIRIFGDFTSVLFYKYIGTDNGDIANISVPSGDFDLLCIFIPLLGSGMILISTIIALAIFIRRLKRESNSESK